MPRLTKYVQSHLYVRTVFVSTLRQRSHTLPHVAYCKGLLICLHIHLSPPTALSRLWSGLPFSNADLIMPHHCLCPLCLQLLSPSVSGYKTQNFPPPQPLLPPSLWCCLFQALFSPSFWPRALWTSVCSACLSQRVFLWVWAASSSEAFLTPKAPCPLWFVILSLCASLRSAYLCCDVPSAKLLSPWTVGLAQPMLTLGPQLHTHYLMSSRGSEDIQRKGTINWPSTASQPLCLPFQWTLHHAETSASEARIWSHLFLVPKLSGVPISCRIQSALLV